MQELYKHINRRRFMEVSVGGAAGALAFPGLSSAATSYPNKVITVVSPFAPGGLNDTCARAVARGLGEEFGSPVVTENRPGGRTLIGLEYVANTPPDGHVLATVTDTNMVYFPATGIEPANFSLENDFAPVTMICSVPTILVTRPDLNAANLREVLELAETRSTPVTFSSAGYGSIAHISGELFKYHTGSYIMHVPYQGAMPAITDVVGGHIDLMFADMGTASAFIRDGKVKPIAITALTRSTAYPDIPTFDELGVKDFELKLWIGIAARAGTPQEVIETLNAAILKCLQRPEISNPITMTGAEIVTNTPEEFQVQILRDRERFGPILKAANISFD